MVVAAIGFFVVSVVLVGTVKIVPPVFGGSELGTVVLGSSVVGAENSSTVVEAPPAMKVIMSAILKNKLSSTCWSFNLRASFD